jgi:hypothetical protein
MSESKIVIRMGATKWDARMRNKDGAVLRFDFKAMNRMERSDFHRELVRACRAAAARS